MRRELETEVITTRFSSAIGWIIMLSRALEEDGDREIGEIAADLMKPECAMDGQFLFFSLFRYYSYICSGLVGSTVVLYSGNVLPLFSSYML